MVRLIYIDMCTSSLVVYMCTTPNRSLNGLSWHTHTHTCVHTHTHTHTHTHAHVQRERERERESHKISMCAHIHEHMVFIQRKNAVVTGTKDSFDGTDECFGGQIFPVGPSPPNPHCSHLISNT